MKVRLVLHEGLDDHSRPRKVKPFDRVVPPLSQMALWLWEDGRVERHNRPPDLNDGANQPDDVAGCGHDGVWDDSAWQVAVLTTAGFGFEPVLF